MVFKRIRKLAAEHATHAVIAGSIAMLTGFAPEQWFERAMHAIHIPDQYWRLVDIRIALVLLGVGVIVGDVLYRRHQRARAPATAEAAAAGAALPSFGDRPAIAVLPFNNMSGDPEQDYFADGISEDLIASISGWSRFPVIARNSSFAYRGPAVDIKAAGRELGARYIVEGSVRRSGNRVRVAAQLVDADSGRQVWGERYDREIDDIFAIQDEITTNIVAAIEPELDQLEEHRAARAGKVNLKAYDLVQRGNWHHNKFTEADSKEARRYYAEAIASDPDYGPAYAAMAYALYWAAQLRWEPDAAATLQKAHEFARKAVNLDPKDAKAHMYLGQISLFLRRHDDAILETRRSIELNPSLAHAYSVLGYALNSVGQFDEAIKTVTQSLRLRPQDRTLARCLPAIAVAHYEKGEYGDAEEVARRAVTINPIYWIGHQVLAASLGQLGRKEEGARKVAEIRQHDPSLTLEAYSKRLPFRDAIYSERIAEGLRKAGWDDAARAG